MPTDVEVYEALTLRIEVDRDGTRKYFNSAGEIHRDNGPAVEYKSGSKGWFQNGKLHRTGGPAVEWSNGDEEWWIDSVEYSEHDYYTALKSQECKHDN